MKALITNCTRNSGLALMRALSRTGWTVAGADDRRVPLGLRSRYCAAPYHTLPEEKAPRLVGELLALIDALGPDVMIPSRCIEVACRMQDQLAGRVHTLLPPVPAFEALNDKRLLIEQCRELGIPATRRFTPSEAADMLRAEPGLALVVKPSRDVGGGRGLRFVRSAAELGDAVKQAAAYGDSLITEYIPGPVENLAAAHLLFDAETRLVGFFVLRKRRLWPPESGVTVAAESTHELDLVRSLLPLFERLRWRGPADAEFKLDARDGVAKILEINPRFSGAIHFPIACGVDFASTYAKAALGERLESSLAPRYAAGVRYVDFGPWSRAAWLQLRRGRRWPALLRRLGAELRGPRVPSVHSFRDPGPLLGKALMMFSAGGTGPHDV